jgi:hypothetical protein
MDVTIEELSPEQQLQLKEAFDQFQQKCLMSFSKNRSGVPYLKSDMPRVLLLGELDTTSAEEKQEVFRMVQKALEDIMVSGIHPGYSCKEGRRRTPRIPL